MKPPSGTTIVLTCLMALLLVPSVAHAYLGPGGVVSGIGALLALIAAVLAAFLGFFWFPIKRLLMWIRGRGPGVSELPPAAADPARE